MGAQHSSLHKQLDLNTTSLTATQKNFIEASKTASNNYWWSTSTAAEPDLGRRSYYTTIFLLKPPRQLRGSCPLLPTYSPSQTRHNKVAAAAILPAPAPRCLADSNVDITAAAEDEHNNNDEGTQQWLGDEIVEDSKSAVNEKQNTKASTPELREDANIDKAADTAETSGNKKLIEHILRTLSTSSSSSSPVSVRSVLRRRSDSRSSNNSAAAKQQQQQQQQNITSHHFRLRVASVLAISPKSLVSSRFRGLRRAASASTSSLSCCSSSASTTATHLGAALNSSSAFSAYPYPRSHTTLMVLPAAGAANTPRGSTSVNMTGSRSGSAGNSRYGSKEWIAAGSALINEQEDAVDYDNNNLILNYPNGDGNNNTPSYTEAGSTAPSAYNFISRRPRPPLNRAIPPIPESKSNESIISAQSSSLAASSTARKQSINNNNNGGASGSTKVTVDNTINQALREENEDKSVVIENPMAKNLGAKPHKLTTGLTSSRLPRLKEHKKKGGQSKAQEDPTKSPLMSMAHSVKHRLTKFGTRFGVGKEQHEPIKASTSLMAMRREVSGGELSSGSSKITKPDKSTKNLVNLRLLKSSSMEESSASEHKKRLREDQQRLQQSQKQTSSSIMSQSASPAAGYGWYMSGDSAIPRRLPSTTLIPVSPMTGGVMLNSSFGARRFVPEDCPPLETPVQPSQEEEQIASKEVCFEEKQQINQQILTKDKEIDYIELNTEFEPRIQEVEAGPEPPPPSQSLPPKESGCDLWEVPLAGTLRKTPQSFPPMPNSVHQPRRPGSLKSPLSVSFAAGDERGKCATVETLKGAEKKSRDPSVSSSHGLFSTRSLRLAAAKIAEASPIMRRKGKTSSVDEGNVQPGTSKAEPKSKEVPPKKSSSFSTKNSSRRAKFTKSASIPSEEDYIASKKGKKSAVDKRSLATVSSVNLASAEEMKLIKKLENSFDLATKKFDLRTVRSIHQKKTSRAPLAEIESSKVEESSPAVELPPIDFSRRLHSSPGQQRRQYLTSFTSGKTVVVDNLAGSSRKEQEGETATADGACPPKAGPTLAELLASPPTRHPRPLQTGPLVLDGTEPEPAVVVPYPLNALESSDKQATLTTTALESHRSGLIDDEIVDQPLLISTSDFALIDDITTISSASAISHPPTVKSNPPATLSTCLLRYCLEDEDDRASCATNDSFLQSVGVNRPATKSGAKKSGLPKPTTTFSNLSSVPEMSKEKKNGRTTTNTVPKTQEKTTKIVERTQVVSTGNRPKSQKELPKHESSSGSSRNGSLSTTPSSQNKHFPNASTSIASTTAKRNGGPGAPAVDSSKEPQPASFPLPEMLTDFKSQLCQLQEAMKKDFEEIEHLRLENESMRHQLAERDQLIHSLQLQMQQLLQTHTPNAGDT